MESTGAPSRVESRRLNLSISSHLGAYIALVRIPNCLLIGLAVLVGETIALGTFPTVQTAVFGFLTASLMLAGTMVLNDIQDIHIDRVNSPERPLPSGKVGLREAYVLSSVLSGFAIVSSLFLGLFPLLIALLALALMAYYNLRGKKTGLLGNAVVSFNVALPFFFGGVAVDRIPPLLSIFFVLAFLANMAREVAKGIADVEGDSAKEVRTIAATRGVIPASRVATALFSTAVLLSFLAPVVERVSIFYYPVVAVADAGFLYSSSRLIRDQSQKTVRAVKTQVLLWMLLGLVAFLLGGISAF